MEFPLQFGRYQLLDRLAVGGMAEVFLARSFGVDGFEKRLVIKRILPELAQNPRFVTMFVHEAKLSVSLAHPNVVQVFELGKVGDDHYISMEHIHGRDLTQTLRATRRNAERLDLGVAAGVAAQVARGLGYAHARTGSDGQPLGIVHRDVSPHNIMVSFEGEVKLVDFGIARLAGETAVAAEPGRPGGGKFAYMSPEQAAGKRLDARSDLFSLGAVLYEMLAGRRLFADGDPDEKLKAVVNCVVPDIRQFRPELPESLRAILARALAPTPDERYPDAAAMEEDLRAFLYESGARGDPGAIGAVLRRLFADDPGDRATGADLDMLAEDLQALHTGLDPEPSAGSHSTLQETASGGSDDRGPRLLAQARGERKSVVVLVAEVNGLTEVSARAEADEIGRIHYRMLRMVRALIDRMGGRAERFDDDTLLVFFGLPRALGDDLDRALACAREFHRLSARLRKRGLPCEFSIGVHIGELNVLRRQGRHFRFAARGDTVKTCVRLAYAAEPATTLVSDRVAALAGDRFPFDRGPELRRKGVRGTRATFLLAGERRRPVRGSAGRWLRRGDELEALREAVASLREGRGSRIAVTGAPGTGKSRLFRELRELATRRAIRVFHGRALPFGADRPLAPFRDLVCDILAIEAEMEPSALRGRLGRLAELHLDDGDIAVIGTLFALDPGRAPGREAVDSAIVKLVRGLASDAPAIVMLEDLHWLDSFERGLFQQLLRAVEGEPVLMLASWRGAVPPEFAPELRQVSLGALSPDQAVAMAAEVVGADAIGPDLTRLVLRTAEGNPLYLEEVLKALQQSGRIYFEGPVARLRDPTVDPGLPDTLQGLIAARVDALDPVAKGALQVAAVIGMTFSPQLLAEAAGTDELMVLVGELVRAGLVVPDSRSPDTSYSFASVLVWESVSRGILGLQRKEYHRMVAAALQRLLGDRLDSAIEAFATHCHAGGRIADAVAATLQAGDQHRAAQYLERALDCYLRGLAWLEKAPRGEREPQVESMLHVSAGEVALLLGLPAAERMLQVALDVASEAGPRAMETRALLALGQLYRSRGRLVLARANLDAARSLARRLHDVASEVQTLEALGAAALDEGRHDEARQLYEEGLHVAGDDRGLAARMLLGLANHALQRDDNASARQLLAEARPLAEGAQDRILLGRIVNNLGIANLNEGRHQEALADFRRALELRRGLGYRHGEAINLHNIGDAWLRLRDPGRAWASFEQSRDVAREAGWERGVAMNDVYLGYLRGLRGEDVGLALQRAAATAQRLGDREIAITGQYFLARLASDTGGIAAARAAALEAGFDGLARWMEG